MFGEKQHPQFLQSKAIALYYGAPKSNKSLLDNGALICYTGLTVPIMTIGGEFMFDIKKFGGHLSRLRKSADMTQSELADRLNLTRQAVSRYELGDSFPDVSVLVIIAEIFGVTLDELINYGEPTCSESLILNKAAAGSDDIAAQSIADVVSLAPLLKPSVLEKLSASLQKQGIDITSVVALSEYLNDDTVCAMLENASFDGVSEELLTRLMPLLNEESKNTIFQKILDGEISEGMIFALIPYADYMKSQIEAAVLDGAFTWSKNEETT